MIEDGSYFSFPKSDTNVIEVEQISAECLSKYITNQIISELKLKHNIDAKTNFTEIQIKVYEDINKCAIYNLKLR